MGGTLGAHTSESHPASNGQMDSHWAQEDTFRRAFQDGPIGMAIVHSNLRFAEVNRHLCHMLGYTDVELAGMSIADITHPDDVSVDVKLAEKLFLGKIPKYSIEKRYITKSGDVVCVQLTATAVRDAEGNILYGLGMFEDLADRKEAERLLQNLVEGTSINTSGSFFRSLAKNLAKAVMVRHVMIAECLNFPTTRVRTLAYWTGSEFSKTVEYDVRGTPCEAVSGGCESFYPDRIQQRFPADEMLVDMEVVSYYGIPLKNRQGHVLGHFALLDDKPMSQSLPNSSALKIFAARAGAELERKQAEQLVRQAERLTSLGTLAAGMAHEINNPLCAITNAAAAALRRMDNAELLQEYLEAIQVSVKRAAEITTNLLRFSHQEDSEKQWNDVSNIVHQAKQLVQPIADEATVEIQLDLADDLPTVMCNATQLEQVIFNLVANAVTASEKNSVVNVRVTTHEESLVMTVQDHGHGMTEEQVNCIFDPFYTTNESGRGTGLGLSVTYGIVNQHNGTIHVDSELGYGASFSVILPLNPPSSADESHVE